MSNSALRTAVKGGKAPANLNSKQTQGALTQAVDKIAGLTKRARASREAMIETGTTVLHSAETQGSLFLASLAEGYLGEEKLRVGGVDVRAPVALVAQGFGLYQTMSGEKGAGAHVLAVGNGVMGSWLASVGVSAGRSLAEKREGGAAPQGGAPAKPPPPSGALTPQMRGEDDGTMPEPSLRGPVREVMLTPPPEPSAQGDVDGRRRRRARDEEDDLRSTRFVRAEARDGESD